MSWPCYHLPPSSLPLLTPPPPQGPSNGVIPTDKPPSTNWMDEMDIADPISPTPPKLSVLTHPKPVEDYPFSFQSGPSQPSPSTSNSSDPDTTRKREKKKQKLWYLRLTMAPIPLQPQPCEQQPPRMDRGHQHHHPDPDNWCRQHHI